MSYVFAKTIETSFEEAASRVRTVLAEFGFGVLTEIDVAATMKAKLGVEMAPYLILGACNPGYAHRALQAEPSIGAMLPCNVIVRQTGEGRIEAAAVDPVASMQAVANPALGQIALEVQGLLRDAIAKL